jgi:flavin-binding protein dodecin
MIIVTHGFDSDRGLLLPLGFSGERSWPWNGDKTTCGGPTDMLIRGRRVHVDPARYPPAIPPPHEGESIVADHVYRVSEIVGTSTESIDAAIRNGIGRAATTLHNLDWFEVTEIRGHLAEGDIAHFQVGLKVGFRLDDPS